MVRPRAPLRPRRRAPPTAPPPSSFHSLPCWHVAAVVADAKKVSSLIQKYKTRQKITHLPFAARPCAPTCPRRRARPPCPPMCCPLNLLCFCHWQTILEHHKQQLKITPQPKKKQKGGCDVLTAYRSAATARRPSSFADRLPREHQGGGPGLEGEEEEVEDEMVLPVSSCPSS